MKGIVFDGTEAKVVQNLEVREPGPREVLVKVVAAGFCHSDLSVINKTIEWPPPVVMGHEGAGIVEKVGPGVTHVQPGDHVVIATLAACGLCVQCASGRPTRCRSTFGNMSQPFSMDGAPVANFAGTSVFTEYTVVRDAQAVKIPKEVPLTTACLIGCGVVTGMGAAMNRADIQLGDTCVVFGVGGVGLNVIQGCKVRGASRIIAVDTQPAKEEWARKFGATDFFDGTRPDLVEQIQAIKPAPMGHNGPLGPGVDHAFDCVGHPVVTQNALASLTWGGTLVIIGVPATTATFTVPYHQLIFVDKQIRGCRYGSISPQRDIPLIVEMYLRGDILLDELVSATYPLENFEDVIHDLHGGGMARGVLTL